MVLCSRLLLTPPKPTGLCNANQGKEKRIFVNVHWCCTKYVVNMTDKIKHKHKTVKNCPKMVHKFCNCPRLKHWKNVWKRPWVWKARNHSIKLSQAETMGQTQSLLLSQLFGSIFWLLFWSIICHAQHRWLIWKCETVQLNYSQGRLLEKIVFGLN